MSDWSSCRGRLFDRKVSSPQVSWQAGWWTDSMVSQRQPKDHAATGSLDQTCGWKKTWHD